ncbi:MAG: FIST signal transduction protein [Congregibacter sp.]
MLEFRSASVRMANPLRAIDELLDACGCSEAGDCDLVIVNASIGHSLDTLVERVRRLCRDAVVVGGSCAGIVGSEGVSETLKDVALMTVTGQDFAEAHIDGISGHNSLEKAEELARTLHAKDPAISIVYLLLSGIDVANDDIILGFERVFGSDIKLFGATTSDNMRGIKSFQAVNELLFEDGAVAVGFSDASLEIDTRSTHGFKAVGEPMTVTAAEGNRLISLDDEPAWPRYLQRLGLPAEAAIEDVIPIGAMAQEISPEAGRSFGNSHKLGLVNRVEGDGVIVYPTRIEPGMKLWITERDEDRIFSDLERMTVEMQEFAAGRKAVAIFQADCLARGRRLFNRIMKEKLVERMQYPFRDSEGAPPWLGMYGFGEYGQLLGRNTFHNYTTTLTALYRKTEH